MRHNLYTRKLTYNPSARPVISFPNFIIPKNYYDAFEGYDLRVKYMYSNIFYHPPRSSDSLSKNPRFPIL